MDPNDIPAVVEIYSKAAGKWFVGLVVKQDGWIAGNAVGMGRFLAYSGRFYGFLWGKSETIPAIPAMTSGAVWVAVVEVYGWWPFNNKQRDDKP